MSALLEPLRHVPLRWALNLSDQCLRSLRILQHQSEEDADQQVRLAPALFKVPQATEADAVARGELRLAQSGALSNAADFAIRAVTLYVDELSILMTGAS